MYSNKRSKALHIQIAKPIAETSKQFCKATHLHGLATYLEIVEMYLKFRSIYRAINVILWTISMAAGFVLCCYLMLKIWQRYSESPTITTIETSNYPIGNVPFPAVTICNVNVVYKPNAIRIAQMLNESGVDEQIVWDFFGSLASLIDYSEIDEIAELKQVYHALRKLDFHTEQLMFDLAQPCKAMLKLCYWLGRPVNCSKLFRRIKTGTGFCCSFNYRALRPHLELKQIDPEVVYDERASLVRISAAGEDASLKVVLDVEPQHYVASKRLFYGAEIIIHDPEAFPGKSLMTSFSEPGQDLSMAVVPSIVSSTDGVQFIPVDLRFCRFESESRLLLTTKYSFQSCISQCRALTVYQTCGCVPFFYPRIKKGDKGDFLSQCTLLDIPCLNENRYIFSSLDDDTVDEIFGIPNATRQGMKCDCLPSCTEKNYDVDTFVSKRSVDFFKRPKKFVHSPNVSSITVFFKDLSCIKYRREISMTWDDLLASFGGVFGLCLGGSVICVFQFVYYLTFGLYEQIVNFNEETAKPNFEETSVPSATCVNVREMRTLPAASCRCTAKSRRQRKNRFVCKF